MHYLALLQTVAPVFAIVAIGFAIRRAGWLTAEADVSLLRVVVNLLYPCLILSTVLGNRALDDPGNVFLAPAVGFGTVVLGYAVAWLAAPLFRIAAGPEQRTFAFTTGLYNYGYLALPIAQSLFNTETAGILFVHNIGVEVAIWTAGILVLTGANPRQAWRRLLSGPVIAIAVAVAFHFAGARDWLPGFALSTAQGLGAAAIPLGLVLTGATFADEMRRFDGRSDVHTSFGAIILRLGLLPVLFLLLARYLPCPVELRRVILIQAAMPSAVIPVILAKHYGGNPATALRIVLATSLAGLLTIPLWLRIGLWWLGETAYSP